MKRILLLLTILVSLEFCALADSDAEVTWINFSDTTSYKSLNLKFGIKAKSQITNFDVVVNGESIRGLNSVVNDGYDMVKSKSVILKDGKNEVEAIVATVNGVTSSKKTITLKSVINPAVVVDDDDTDFEKLRWDALCGDLHSQYILAKKYQQGCTDVDKDLFEAAVWFRESAFDGYHDSEYEYACALIDAKGVLRNVPLAIRYLKLAADGNQQDSLLKLGICYENGVGVAMNIDKAKELYRKCMLPEAKIRLNALEN